MKEIITLAYDNKTLPEGEEHLKFTIPILPREPAEEIITKTVVSLINLFIRLGLDIEEIVTVFITVGSQILESLYEETPNEDSPEDEIITHIKKMDQYKDVDKKSLTLANFKVELKKEEFIQYLYQLFLEDQEG